MDEARPIIRGGVHIHIFVFCPTEVNVFTVGEHEYMNIAPMELIVYAGATINRSSINSSSMAP